MRSGSSFDQQTPDDGPGGKIDLQCGIPEPFAWALKKGAHIFVLRFHDLASMCFWTRAEVSVETTYFAFTTLAPLDSNTQQLYLPPLRKEGTLENCTRLNSH